MKLNAIISDGVVFQRNRPIKVFGEGHGEIIAEFLGERKEVAAGGRFCITFSQHPAGGPYEMHFSDSEGQITVGNIMIGEVILLGGQSNVEQPIYDTYDKDTVFETNESIRFYAPIRPTLDENSCLVPAVNPFSEKWITLSSDTADRWSAIALHTAIHFYEKLHIAVGIVTCAKGASVIETFLSEKANEKFDLDQSKLMSDHFSPKYTWNKPAYLFHYMVEGLMPFQTDAVIWYQGESNRTVYEGGFYDKMLIALIEEWRELFESPQLPFAIVQINLFPSTDNAYEGFVAIREAQKRAVAETAHCELVRIDDLGEHANIHPKNKREVTARICTVLEHLIDFGEKVK